jgi:hypothetical protein
MGRSGDSDYPIRMVGLGSGDEDPPYGEHHRERPRRADTWIPLVVQFHRPLSAEDQQRLKSTYRLKLTSYVPEKAYLESVDPDMAARLADDPLVRTVRSYPDAAKIMPGIGDRVFRTEERQALRGLWLDVVLFDHAEPDAVASRIAELEGVRDVRVVDDRPLGGSAHVRLVAESPRILDELAALVEVRVVDEVPERKEDNANAAGTIQSGTPGTRTLWDQGLHGEGQIVGMIDSSPLDINHCFFLDATNNTPGPAHRKVLDIRNGGGTAAAFHASFVAGCAAGDDVNNPGAAVRRGGAWAARLVSGTTGDVNSGSMLAELSAAAASGATIHTNSWHDDDHGAGNPAPYNQTAVDVDTFTWNNEDHLVLGSAGNTGEEQGSPGTAKNAICVAAAMADPSELQIGDGNPGPTADNRRKPDVVAVGCGITSASAGTACGTTAGSCATSWATPHTAAAAALVRQYLTEGWYPTGAPSPHHAFVPSGALLKAALANGTLDMTSAGGYPNNTEGWGLLRLDDLLHFAGDPINLRVWDYRHKDGLTTGVTHTHHVDVASSTARLKVTLAWTDPPGTLNATTALVNDLDLEVIAPGGQTFLGNVFAAGTSTTGGMADSANNLEAVLVNSPAAGDWTIRVIGRAVNVGSPGQGYGLVVTADLTEPPVATGVQDTVVARVRFADIATEPPLANLQSLMVDVASYVAEVSYGQASVVPRYRGTIDLDHNRDYYSHPDRNPLIELTEEVVGKLVAAEPALFDDVERLLIVTNDVNFTGDWATTGPWPYSLPAGFSRPISVSIHSYANTPARYTHGMLHQFGLVDLYAHPGVVFPRPYVDDWDNMGGTYSNVHPLVWSKERAGWLTAHGDTIEYIPRPAPGASYTGLNPIPLFRNPSGAANRKAIAIGLSEGAATLADENAFYYVEARRNTQPNFDAGLPGSGVLIYYVNEQIPQGEGPVILRDKNLLTTHVGDAFFVVGDVVSIPGTGITIAVLAGGGGAPFSIRVDYTAPVTDYNVRITRGDTIGGNFFDWLSPDIWVDSPKNGFNLGTGPPPHEQRDNPVAGVVNRIYARVRNTGPATAFDFDIRFRISEPYHTVGGEADFDTFVGIKHVSSLAAGAEIREFVEWTPASGDDPHTCVAVDLINLVGTDTNEHDNWAQENLDVVTSVTSSPFHPVTHRYNLTNPYSQERLFYFRPEGVPDGWDVALQPRKIRLQPGQRMFGEITITPPKDAEVCTSQHIAVTSWAPRGDTLIRIGGAVVQVDLRRPTTMTFDAGARGCDGRDLERLLEEAKERGEQIDSERLRKECVRITTQGCLDPPQAGVEVILKYVDPSGNVTYRTAVTDEDGCFEDLMVDAGSGTWHVEADYPGGKCEAPTRPRPAIVCWCP